jgi:tetratricopeptide (TPR) repeat protein
MTAIVMGKPAPIISSTWREATKPISTAESAPDYLLRVVDAGLCGVVCVAPFFFGGRHDFGRLVFVALTAATAVGWFTRQALLRAARGPITGAHIVLLLAVGLLAIQIVPLPQQAIRVLAPRTSELLPLWTPQANQFETLGTWKMVSLDPHETTKSLAMLVSYALLFVVVSGRLQQRSDIERLLQWIAVSAIMMAVFGIVQYVTSDGRFFWFYWHPSRSASDRLSGAFANSNHFAHFLILGVGPLTSWLLFAFRRKIEGSSGGRMRRTRLIHWTPALLILALTVVLFATLLAFSRGATLALLIAIATIAAAYSYGGLIGSKYLWAGLGVTVIVLGLLSMYGYDQLSRRLNTLTRGSLETADHHEGRRKIWRANVAAIAAGGMLGAGAGTHSALYRVYLDASLLTEYTHAESGYLQVATENGFAGVALLIAGLSLCAGSCVTCLRHGHSDADLLSFGAAAAGLAASAVHSIVDFVWYIPACMSLTIVLAACVVRLAQMVTARDTARGVIVLPRAGWICVALTSALAGIWAVHTYVGPGIAAVYWDKYLRLSASSMSLARGHWSNLVAGRPQLASAVNESLNDAIFRQLESVIRWDPKFARAHLRMAAKLVTEFEQRQQVGPNRMGVAQIRDAVRASQFASAADRIAWLRAAFRSDIELLRRAQEEALAAVSLCPLHGEGYLQLAELGFLDGVSDTLIDAYVDQGQRVRPHDADVLFQLGQQELLRSNYAAAFEHWKKCFDDPGPHQLKIIYILAGRISAEALLTGLAPDWRTLPIIWARYREYAPQEELDVIIAYAAQATQREIQKPIETPAANIWLNQAKMLADVGRQTEALDCLHRAYSCDPRQYAIRYALAKTLVAAEKFTEAEPHFRWCLARHPQDKSLRDALVTISKQQMAQREQKFGSPSRSRRREAIIHDAQQAVPKTSR